MEITELPSESDSLLERSPSREHTYVEVDLDLDNPVVSEDSEEARRRFCAAMKQSVEAMRQHREVPLFVKQLHEKRGKDGLETRESLVGGIAESVARAKIGRKGRSQRERWLPRPRWALRRRIGMRCPRSWKPTERVRRSDVLRTQRVWRVRRRRGGWTRICESFCYNTVPYLFSCSVCCAHPDSLLILG